MEESKMKKPEINHMLEVSKKKLLKKTWNLLGLIIETDWSDEDMDTYEKDYEEWMEIFDEKDCHVFETVQSQDLFLIFDPSRSFSDFPKDFQVLMSEAKGRNCNWIRLCETTGDPNIISTQKKVFEDSIPEVERILNEKTTDILYMISDFEEDFDEEIYGKSKDQWQQIFKDAGITCDCLFACGDPYLLFVSFCPDGNWKELPVDLQKFLKEVKVEGCTTFAIYL